LPFRDHPGRSGARPHPRAVTAFLQGLLAEGNLRENLAFEASITPDDVFGMVSAYGRDTAGAATMVGLSTITAVVTHFEGVRALVISRYDRSITAGGQVERVHQEDTAQALGLDTRDMNRKFQRGKNLPSLRAIAAVLRNGGQEPDPSRWTSTVGAP
jgi:hypothetical protein